MTLPVGTVGEAYSQQLTASGGSGSGYNFDATGLPPGLSLSTSGLLSGTPTTATGSPFAVDVTVTDSDGGMGSQNYMLTVNASSIYGIIVTSLAKSYYGQEVTLTATFYATPSGSAQMTGTVAFYDGQTYMGTEPFIAAGDPSGSSSLPTSSLAVGNHVITAIYSGDANYPAATVQVPVAVEVIQAVTSITLTAAAGPQGTTLTANVVATSPGNPAVVGTVSFYDGDTLLGTEIVSNGIATLNVGPLSPGSHAFKAVFSGNGSFSASASAVVVPTEGPEVTGVLRYGFHLQPTYLLLAFNGPLDPNTAQNPLNYQILGPGGHQIRVVSAIYDSATDTVTLVPAARLKLRVRYRLTVNGKAPSGLANPSGILLDGAGNGHPGTDYVTSITWSNLRGRAGTADSRSGSRSPLARGQNPDIAAAALLSEIACARRPSARARIGACPEAPPERLRRFSLLPMGDRGLEPLTSCVSGRRSSQRSGFSPLRVSTQVRCRMDGRRVNGVSSGPAKLAVVLSHRHQWPDCD